MGRIRSVVAVVMLAWVATGCGQPSCDGGCDDGIECTRDSCGPFGSCEHALVDVGCGPGEHCDPSSGCRPGEPCIATGDCSPKGFCLTVVCSPDTGRCEYSPLDGDADGHPAAACGGDDCNDADPAVHATSCECPAPWAVCAGPLSDRYCTDLATDELNCGACGTRCGTGWECVEGSCRCPFEQTCDASCVDVSSDARHCGECSNHCGDGTCDSGTCACRPGDVYCTTARGLDCADLATDPRHCGACSARCPVYAACESGTCSVRATLVRGYGGLSRGETPDLAVFASFDTANEATYVAAVTGGTGPLQEMGRPFGPELVERGPVHVVKLDAAGSIVWHLTSDTLNTRGIAYDADRVWLIGTFTRPAATLGPSTFSRGAWAGASIALIELDASNGSLITSRIVPVGTPIPTHSYFVAAGGGEVVFSGRSGDGATFGGASFSAGTFVARYTPGLVHVSSLRHDAIPLGLRMTASGEVLSFGRVGTGSVQFDATTISAPASWVTSWASDATLVRAFAAQGSASAIEPVAGGVWVAASDEPSLQLWSFSGGTATPSTATPPGWSTSPWIAGTLRAYGDDLFAGASLTDAGTIDGHEVRRRQPLVMRIDAATLAIERLAAVGIEDDGTSPYWITGLDPRGPTDFQIVGLAPGELRVSDFVVGSTGNYDTFYVADFAMTP